MGVHVSDSSVVCRTIPETSLTSCLPFTLSRSWLDFAIGMNRKPVQKRCVICAIDIQVADLTRCHGKEVVSQRVPSANAEV